MAITGAEDITVVPKVELDFGGQGSGGSAATAALIRALAQSKPVIHVDPIRYETGVVVLNPMCLRPGEAEKVTTAIVRHLG